MSVSHYMSTRSVIDYVVYRTEADGGPKWTVIHDFDTTGWAVVDRRKGFAFRVGMNEIEPEIEKRIFQQSPLFIRNFNFVYHVTLVEGGAAQVTADEVFTDLVNIKERGNGLLKKGELAEALAAYSQGIDIITSPDFTRRTEKDVKEVVIPMYLNKALCCLQLNMLPECIECCTCVIELDRNNAKALFRRGVARMENRDFGGAKRDLLSAQFVEPKDTAIRDKLKELERSYLVPVRSCNSSTNVLISIAIGGFESVEPIELKLHDDIVPRTVANFKALVDQYQDMQIFKLVRGQFFQTGDYEYNDGSGGNCAVKPDREIRGRKFFNDEWLGGKHDRIGLVGMSNYGPNTNQSQFYITLGECPHLDGKHVIFGEVVGGLATLDRINTQAHSDIFESRPTTEIRVMKVVVT